MLCLSIIPEGVLKGRVKAFQKRLRDSGIDAAMIRVLSTFIYFTGVKWLRPSLMIPAEGNPVLFAVKGEEKGLRSLSWLDSIVTYREGGELMGKVSGLIRERKYSTVGLEFSLERDSFILFYEMFKRLNPSVKVVDISPITQSMREIKDEYELEAIRRAGRIAAKAMRDVEDIIKPGMTEVEIAAEIYRELYRAGSEEPLVYVNAGPHPRIHAEPLHNVKVIKDSFVTIVVSADYGRYYANMARTYFIGEPNELAKKSMECMNKVYEKAIDLTRPGIKFSEVMIELDKIYREYGMTDFRVLGYTHGVGLQVEETPITTIVPKDRFLTPEPGMVLAMVHAPILIEGLGQIKLEDTFVVNEDGILERVTET